jgi:hypothetical protein
MIYQLPECNEISIWLDLGLFGGSRATRSAAASRRFGGVAEVADAKEKALLFCLICHVFIASLDNTGLFWRPNPDFGGDLLGPSAIRDQGVIDKLQGHLLAHFTLQDERIAIALRVLLDGAGEEFVSRLSVEHEATANYGHVGESWVTGVKKLFGAEAIANG